MRTTTVTAADLDVTAVGLGAIFVSETGERFEGVISDVYRTCCPCGCGTQKVWLWMAGSILVLKLERLLELEMTPTELEALADLEQRQAVDLANSGKASAVEQAIEASADQVPTGRLSGFAISALLSISIASMALAYGLRSPALSGHTILAMVLVVIAAVVLFRIEFVARTKRRWVL